MALILSVFDFEFQMSIEMILNKLCIVFGSSICGVHSLGKFEENGSSHDSLSRIAMLLNDKHLSRMESVWRRLS